MEITFEQPIYLWTLVIIPVLVVMYFISFKYSKSAALKFANFVALSRVSGGVKETPNVFALVIRMVSLVTVVLSISGIVVWSVGETANKDYIIAIDASSSMSADDFEPNRLEVAKISAIEFIDDLPINSYVGVVSFSGVSFVDHPLTQDKGSAKEAVSSIELKTIGGTDLGNAIMTGTNLLIPSKKAKSIILLTDGRSNIGISKNTAISYAIDHHVVVSTIGIGSKDEGELSLGIDEKELKDIADLTLGNSFVAETPEDLKNIYDGISSGKSIGKNPFNLSFIFLLISLVLLLTDWLLGNVFYRIIP